MNYLQFPHQSDLALLFYYLTSAANLHFFVCPPLCFLSLPSHLCNYCCCLSNFCPLICLSEHPCTLAKAKLISASMFCATIGQKTVCVGQIQTDFFLFRNEPFVIRLRKFASARLHFGLFLYCNYCFVPFAVSQVFVLNVICFVIFFSKGTMHPRHFIPPSFIPSLLPCLISSV